MTLGIQTLEQLRELHVRMHRLFNDRARASGASLAQLKVMILLDRSGSIRSTDIADALEQAPRTVTEAIDALERDGLVVRSADPSDRRAKRITLTDAGRKVVTKVAPIRDAFTSEFFAPLADAEIEELLRMLRILNERTIEMGAPAATHGAAAKFRSEMKR